MSIRISRFGCSLVNNAPIEGISVFSRIWTRRPDCFQIENDAGKSRRICAICDAIRVETSAYYVGNKQFTADLRRSVRNLFLAGPEDG
tara:strand:- start:14791 stop:15054 length:264 start_codon:yes stop_codon:yes gene_type:complete